MVSHGHLYTIIHSLLLIVALSGESLKDSKLETSGRTRTFAKNIAM